MIRRPPLAALLALCLATTPASADRGALTVEAGGGGSGTLVPAPWSSPRRFTPSLAGLVSVSLRYALSNHLELTAGGFFEPPVLEFHADTTIETDNGAFRGTLRHQLIRWGALAGARAVIGMVWRLVLGLELGWSHRDYAQLQHLDVSSHDGPLDFGLSLPSFAADNLLLVPSVGLEWAGGDHWSISLVPKVHLLVGPEPTVAVLLPLTLSWSWYL